MEITLNVRTVQVWMWNISGLKITCILCLPAGEVGGEYTSKVGNIEGETRERIRELHGTFLRCQKGNLKEASNDGLHI